MNFSFRQNSPINSLVIDTATGQPLYDIDTPWSFGAGMTTIRRVGDEQFPVAGQIDWGRLSGDKVQIINDAGAGKWVEVGNFLSKDGIFSSSRTFMGPNGVQYKWKSESRKCFLVNRSTHAIVAESHRKKLGIFGDSRMMNLDVKSEVLGFVDVILITYIIMEKKKRDSQRSSGNAGAASTGGGC